MRACLYVWDEIFDGRMDGGKESLMHQLLFSKGGSEGVFGSGCMVSMLLDSNSFCSFHWFFHPPGPLMH